MEALPLTDDRGPLLDLGTTFGAPKNEVILPFPFGFLASEVGTSVALRFKDMVKRRIGDWN